MTDNPLVQRLRQVGVNITGPRVAICTWLYTHPGEHPTAAELFAALADARPPLSLATVYNTLRLLEDLGLVHVVGTTSNGHKRYDVNLEPHVNLVSRTDGEVIDIHDPALLAEARRVIRAHGMDPNHFNLVLFGQSRPDSPL